MRDRRAENAMGGAAMDAGGLKAVADVSASPGAPLRRDRLVGQDLDGHAERADLFEDRRSVSLMGCVASSSQIATCASSNACRAAATCSGSGALNPGVSRTSIRLSRSIGA